MPTHPRTNNDTKRNSKILLDDTPSTHHSAPTQRFNDDVEAQAVFARSLVSSLASIDNVSQFVGVCMCVRVRSPPRARACVCFQVPLSLFKT